VSEKNIEALKIRLEKLRAERRALREKISDLKKEHRQAMNHLKEGWRLLDALPGGVVLIQEGKITFINETARKALAYGEEEILGHDFAECIHPEFRSEALERHKRRLSGKPVPNRYETCFKSRNGKALWCEVHVKKVLLGGRRAFLLNLIGLNERKEHEKRLAASKKREAIVRMCNGLHQEMKEWLAALEKAYSPYSVQGGLNQGGQTGNVDKIWEMLERWRSLSEQLDWLGRKEQDLGQGDPYDLRKVVQDVVSYAKNRWCAPSLDRGKGISIKSYLRTLPLLMGRPEEIKYAITRLVENAVEALDNGGNIYLTTEESEGYAHVYVQDNGSGIPSELEDKIYDPFFTTKGGTRKGLGLSLALAIVRRNGGEIDLHSTDGGGTTCTVRLPIPQKNPNRNVAAARKRIKDMRILIVSAQDILRDLLCRLFSNKGCQVDAAMSSGEAFQLLPRKEYGLLVVDTEDMDRKSVASVLKKAKNIRPEMPIVLIDAPGYPGLPERTRDKYGDLVLEKPLDMDKVQTLVMDILSRRGLGP